MKLLVYAWHGSGPNHDIRNNVPGVYFEGEQAYVDVDDFETFLNQWDKPCLLKPPTENRPHWLLAVTQHPSFSQR